MNLSIWDIMGPAFFELLILVGIHSYLGLHVIRRKVIFVDLALAQIAALGTTVGFLFGILPDATGSYWFSLAFTFLGAAIFSISRIRNEKIPQEAVIGLVYAIAAAISILVIDKAPHGAEHIKEILTGSILWVKWSTVETAAIVYSLVGIFHFIYRKQFLLISNNPEKAYDMGMSIRFWDFLFYVSFGIVISISVRTAGVLLVFVFLIAPAITSMLITDKLWKQLTIGWSMGVIVSILGLYISYAGDLPSGPTVVTFYGGMLVLVAILLYIIRAKKKSQAVMKVGLGTVVTIAIIFGFYLMGNAFGHLDHKDKHIEMEKTETINKSAKTVIDLSTMTDAEVNKTLSEENDISVLKKLFDSENDSYTKFKIAKRAIKLDKKAGSTMLLSILKFGGSPFVNQEVNSELKKVSGKDFGFDSMKEKSENKAALEKWEKWIDKL